MKKRVSLVACFLLAAVTVLSGCSSGSPSPMPAAESAAEEPATVSYDNESQMPATMPEAKESGAGVGGSASVDVGKISDSDQKIIRNADISMETKYFDDTVESLNKQVKESGGYVESSNLYGKAPVEWNDEGRRLVIKARIPSANLDSFLKAAKSNADVLNEKLSAENISDHYYDTVARKNSYELQLKTLEELLGKAESLEDVITLEQEIARVRYEIESMETSLRRYDNQVAYSTVDISLYELTTLDRPKAVEETFGTRLGSTFTMAIKNAQRFLEELVIGVVYILPTLLIIAVIAVFILFIVFKVNKAIIKRRDKENEPIVLKNKKDDDSKGSKPEDKN